jgi:ATP-dependent Clp protease ATP-binding subunit ClpC
MQRWSAVSSRLQWRNPPRSRQKRSCAGIVPKYEKYHEVKVTDEAIRAAVALSVRYINDRNLPDKAIDVIDEACSAVRLRAVKKDDTLQKLEEQILSEDGRMAEAIKAGEIARAKEIRLIRRER